MEIDKLFQHGADAAKFLFDKQGFLVPMWLGINEQGGHIPLLVNNLDDKDITADTVRRFLKKEKIVSYVSMLECWTYQGKEIPPEIAAGKSLEDNPDRREAIHILAEDKDGSTVSGCFYILRPEHGNPKLSPLKVYEKAERTEGRFAKMFD